MNAEELYLNFIDKERNIYEPAQLFHQNRNEVSSFYQNLASPGQDGAPLELQNDKLVCKKTNRTFPIENNVVDFIKATEVKKEDAEWQRLNTQFMNYHKSLSVYTLVNSTPVGNYLGLRSGMADIKNKTVIDVGGGTGEEFVSFFHYPETLNYYLVDPNLRLLHDQFLRIYPKLTFLKMSHLLAYAEELPFKSGYADVVMTIAAIDHFKDYKKFFAEAYRVLKPGGTLFVSSHLDLPPSEQDATKTSKKILSESFFERLTRYLYYKKSKVGHDDHTYHWTNLEPFETGIKEKGFTITKSEMFKRYFFVVAQKPM